MRAIPRVFGIGSLSYVQARMRPRFCMTIIIRRDITGILEDAKRHAFATARRLVADFLADARAAAGDRK